MAAEEQDESLQRPADLRVVLLAVMSWAGALAGFLCPAWATGAILAGLILLLLGRWRAGRPVVVLSACLIAGTAVTASAMLRAEANRHNAVALSLIHISEPCLLYTSPSPRDRS